ncbi:MAG: caspase family protein [Hyphomicrobiales bacterium]|nr:caspase family protein [Hyphomicrobiales bacterium]
MIGSRSRASCRSLGMIAALALGALAAPGGASAAENRVALVIGNSAYQAVPALPNPRNDANAMTELLRSANFDVVSAPDLTQSEMRRAIGELAERVARSGSDTVALVFYAGHGLQVDGDNYLVPVDARIQRESDVALQAVRLVDLMNALASVPSKMRIVMLDACRNNPFSEINKVTGRGLAIVDAPPGSIVSYSTSPGTEALDGDGANSPYTTALLNVAREPGLPIEQAFKRVRFAVTDTTHLQQTPWESSSLTGDFSFFPDAGGGTTRPPSATQAGGGRQASRSVDAWKQELRRKPAREAYEIVIKEDAVEAYQAFIDLFPREPSGPRLREIVERRRVMVAWLTAGTINTPSAFQSFLASYPNSDLTISAQRLLDRALNRSVSAEALRLAGLCPCTPSAPAVQPTRRAGKSTTRNAAREDTPTVRRATTPAATPVAPIAPIGVGIGIGIGRIPIGGRGGRGGGGGHGAGGSQPTGPVRGPMSHPR